MAEPQADHSGEAEDRFAPARLRAVALREQIEATHADLAATVAELEEQTEIEVVDGTVEPSAVEPVAAPEPTVESAEPPREPAAAVEPPPRAPPGRPRAVTAVTFAVGLGAGLLLRRR